MGYVYAEIEMANYADIFMVWNGMKKENEIRRLTSTMLVDTGAYMMAINEHIQAQLGLHVLEQKEAEMADGRKVLCDVVGPLEIRFENRRASVEAIVLPGNSKPLLGAIPMEYMDVLIDPRKQRLIVNPESPYVSTTFLK